MVLVRFVRTFLTARSSFVDLGLLPSLSSRIEASGIHAPTEIQSKSLPALIEGKSAVINAETGSGKTLCYLLPFVQKLYQLPPPKETGPVGLFVVPNQELSYQVLTVKSRSSLVSLLYLLLVLQVSSVFDTLVSGRAFCMAAVCSSGRLVLQDSTVAIVGTVSSLVNYHWPVLLKSIQYVVVDEADMILSGASGETMWKILNYLKNPKQQRDSANCHPSAFHPQRQFVFSGATIPSGGKMAIQSVIARWFKQTASIENAAFLSSCQAHGPVPTTDFEFVHVTEESKISELVRRLNDIKSELESSDSLCRILVFTNTLASCQLLHTALVDMTTTNQSLWWSKKMARFDKRISTSERVGIWQRFNDGRLQVLVCTDLASRGLDIPDIQAVIQFDFPENSTSFLHRAGRTGRAGKQGKVVSFVSEESSELASLVEHACLKDQELCSFDDIFSRNRKLRQRLRAKSNKATN